MIGSWHDKIEQTTETVTELLKEREPDEMLSTLLRTKDEFLPHPETLLYNTRNDTRNQYKKIT